MLKLHLLGTGTSQGVPVLTCGCAICKSEDPRDKRLRTAAVFEVDGKAILIDAGPDFRQQMLSLDLQRLDAICISHEHNDHVAGLDDVRPFNFRYDMDMPVYAQKRVMNALEKRFGYIFKSNYPGVPRILLQRITAGQVFEAAGIPIRPIAVQHGKLPILGFRIRKVAYLTDVRTLCTESKAALQNLEVLVVSALHRMEHHAHQTLEEALELIKELQPKRAYLVHVSHLMGLHEEVEKELPENVHLGYDGLCIEVKD